jgi:hypothetical protein
MRARDAFAAVAFLIVCALAAPGWAQSRTCVRAAVGEPFLLPDGSQHRAGPVRICLDRLYSPSCGLHTIEAADGGVGSFLSRRGRAESAALPQAPRIFFGRDGRQRLTLLGYTVGAGDTTQVYWLQR